MASSSKNAPMNETIPIQSLVPDFKPQTIKFNDFLKISNPNYSVPKVVQEFKCETANCSKIFTTKGHLLDHQEREADLKGYSCLKCSKKFNTQRDTEAHYNGAHSDQNSQITCPYQNCGRILKNSQGLNSHNYYMHGKFEYVCTYGNGSINCSHKYAGRNGVTSHLARTHGVKTKDWNQYILKQVKLE